MARNTGSVAGTVFQNANSTFGGVGPVGTISMWISPNWSSGDGVTHPIWEMSNFSSNSTPGFQRFSDNNIYIGFLGGGGGDQRIVLSDSGLFTSGTAANWVFTWSNAAGQTIYKNAISKGTHALTFPTANVGFGIGNYGEPGNSAAATSNSIIADFCYWNTILTPPELIALAMGNRASAVRPASIRLYYPLYGSANVYADIYGGQIIKATGTITTVADPPLLRRPVNTLRANFWPGIDALGWIPPRAVVLPARFRKTLSSIGGRVGTRQSQGWGS